MKHKMCTFAMLALGLPELFAQLTPEIYSWKLNTTGATGYSNIPSNIQQVQYSSANVYVSASCIPGYDIGPWAGNPNLPANQNFVFKITRNPVQNTGTPVATGLGHIGVFSNGVSIFNPRDAMSYLNQNVWFQNAIVVEGPSFDHCLGHPAPNGEYHHHLNPTCLYLDSLSTSHSPIVGFAFDGFPIYGAFAYANTNGTGGIKRMQSSYQKRNITARTTLPDGSTAASAGPNVSTTYPIGYYVQDFVYTQGSGDLDEHNGRYCITPDYPSGQYCYFVTLDSNLVAEYPYIIGTTYYGTVQPGNTGPGSGHNTVTEPVTNYNGALGIADPGSSSSLEVFPNPARQVLNIKVKGSPAGAVKLKILDITGREVYGSGSLQPVIDLSEFATGVYFIEIRSGENFTIKKILVE